MGHVLLEGSEFTAYLVKWPRQQPSGLGPIILAWVPSYWSWQEVLFLLTALADQIPCGIISPWFCPIVANSCLKLERVPWLSVASVRWLGCRDSGAGSAESSVPSVSSRHQTLRFPVRKEPSSAPFQLSLSCLCLFLLATQLAALVGQSLIKEARETGTMWRWGCRAQHELHLTLSLLAISLFWTYFIKYMSHNVIGEWNQIFHEKSLAKRKCSIMLPIPVIIIVVITVSVEDTSRIWHN